MNKIVTEIEESSFDENVINADSPVIVDFWASWCQPCLRLMPIYEACAKDYQGYVRFMKCNVESNQTIAQKFGVRGIPTLLLFNDGKLIATKVGGDLSQSQLATFIDNHL